MKRFIAIIFLIFTCKNCLLAQNNITDQILRVAGPPPEAAAFTRYGEIPVDYSTGIPKIEIPLYTVKSRKLSLPINLSYHAGGIKVMDEATSVGLGWIINAGGIITRTIVDKEDGLVPQTLHYKSQHELDSTLQHAMVTYSHARDPDVDQIGDNLYIDHLYADNSSDRYYYVLPNGKNGIFRYDIFSSHPKAIQAPYSTVNINTLGSYPSITGYTLTDDDGTIYNFNTTGTDSWHLNQMISADKTDTISFYYDHTNSGANIGLVQTFETGPWYTAEILGQCGAHGTLINWEKDENTNDVTTESAYPWTGTGTTPLIDRIETSSCVVRFYYESRSDIVALRLSQVKVFDKSSNALIKEYDLIHSYFGSAANNNLRLRLDSVYSKNTVNSAIEKYNFKYNQTELPAYTTLTNKQFHEDYWGYYNGTTTTGAIPDAFLPAMYQTDPSIAAVKVVNPEFAKAETLEAIYYPTGGKTIFEYESNDGVLYNYPSSSNYTSGYGGGLRVKTITSYKDANSQPEIKTYKYYGGGQTITSDMFSYNQRYVFINGTDGTLTTPVSELNRQVYVSTPLLPLTFPNGSSVGYSEVEEYNGNESENTGKTVYDYTSLPPINPIEVMTVRFRDANLFDIGIPKANLEHKYTYKRMADNTYKLVYGLDNTYTIYHGTQSITGFVVNKLTTYWEVPYGDVWYWPETSEPTDGPGEYCPAFFADASPSSIQFYHQLENYNSIVNDGVQILSKSVETTLDDNNNYASKTKYYNYDNLVHLQPTKETTILSTGDSIITRYKYPHDFVGTQPYTDMVNTYHIWSPIIEHLDYKNVEDNTHFLQSTITNYAAWNSNSAQIYPFSLQTKKGNITNGYDTRIQYFGYDNKGNMQSASKAGGPKVNYIYGYGGNYPIAQVVNADYSAIVAAFGSQAAIDSFRDNSSPSDATVNTFLAPLRNRSLFPNAQVTTYTYKPLVGMTSMTDARGNTTYYEYDSFQRLVNVKDQNGNIKTHYCYNYAGQSVDCKVIAATPPAN